MKERHLPLMIECLIWWWPPLSESRWICELQWMCSSDLHGSNASKIVWIGLRTAEERCENQITPLAGLDSESGLI